MSFAMSKENTVDLKQIQTFFFKSMTEGWTTKDQKIEITDMPGYKAIPFRNGDFYLLDRYCVTPRSTKSAGTTTIWFQNIPVWLMNYGGFYEDGAILFLKQALRETYERGQFVGGRGPLTYTDGSSVYVNKPLLNNFSKFEGREEVFDTKSGASLGFHEYWGMSLL